MLHVLIEANVHSDNFVLIFINNVWTIQNNKLVARLPVGSFLGNSRAGFAMVTLLHSTQLF